MIQHQPQRTLTSGSTVPEQVGISAVGRSRLSRLFVAIGGLLAGRFDRQSAAPRPDQMSWGAGARILHSIGTWPAVIDDETVVENCITGEELVLLAKIRPAAEARITLQLTDIAGGCRVAMTEVAVSAPLRWVPDSVQLTAVAPRNRECTWRLAMIAENADPDALG